MMLDKNRNSWLAIALLGALGAAPGLAQERRGRIDVEHTLIEAELNPRASTINARVAVRFIPVDDRLTTATFDLANTLSLAGVTDGTGQSLQFTRNRDDFSVRVSFPNLLEKGRAQTLLFTYEGRFQGDPEESPVYGVKFAGIHEDHAFLTYPARWFPVNEYSADRFASTLKITVPSDYKIVSSGLETKSEAGGKITYEFDNTRAGFPGSIAMVKGPGKPVRAEGLTTTVWFRGGNDKMAIAYGEQVAKTMTWLTSIYGLPPSANLAVIETEKGAPNGYSAPGILFLASPSIGEKVNEKLLANQVSRQWWGNSVSPASRSHVWLANGAARYTELLYTEKESGEGALESDLRDLYVDALTVSEPPVIQAARLEDYSPEYWAVTGAKGAAVFSMLRYSIGDEAFTKTIKTFLESNIGRSVTTDDFRKAAEQASGRNLQGFFIQWIESTGAPEFQTEYTVFRTQKGFRVMGKITQDLDTFRSPVEIKIETEGNPEFKQVEVVGTQSEFVIETFGRPKKITIDPNMRVLRASGPMRVAVAIRRGEMFAEISEFAEALKEYQKALDVDRNSSLAHYRVAEVFFLQGNYQAAANEFREVINGNLEPKWTEVWAHINLGQIFDITGQRERAVNEYNLAIRTKDNTQGAQEVAAEYLKTPYERPARTN